MVTICVSDYGDFDSALRAFRKKVRKAQIIEKFYSKTHYVSPSERKHRLRLKKKQKYH